MTGTDAELEQCLRGVLRGEPLTSEAIAHSTDPATAYPCTPDDLHQRAMRLQTLYPALQDLCHQALGWDAVPLLTLWRLWLPLAESIVARQAAQNRPIVQGFLGGQGTGKTTLTQILTHLLSAMGYRAARLSLDDLYKTYAERQQLQRADPRLRWRGPPGTHDVEMGLEVLQRVRLGTDGPIWVPRFDKSQHGGMGDRTAPEAIAAVDVLLFEGWFVGIRPIDPGQFDTAPPPIELEGDRAFARDCNTRLQAYVPLWDLLDALVVLHPVDYRLSKIWRKQAEQAMVRQGRSGMTDEAIDQFVEYFWKALHPELFWPPLLKDAQRVDWIVDIQPDHTPSAVYRPGMLPSTPKHPL